MRLLNVLAVSLTACVTFSAEDLTFSLEYFKYRQVKFLCLLICEDITTARDFMRGASKLALGVSLVRIDKEISVRNDNLGLSKCLQQQFTSIGVSINAECRHFEKVMTYASENVMLDDSHKWLILNEHRNFNSTKTSTPDDDISNTLKTLEKLNISVNTDITIAVQKGRSHYQLNEVYNFGKTQGGDLMIRRAEDWESRKWFQTNLNAYKYYRRWNFHQCSMKMISVVSPAPLVFDPKILTDLNPTPGVAVITKTSFASLSVVAEIHNLRFQHSIADVWMGDYNLSNSQVSVATHLYYRLQDITPILRFIKDVHDKIDLVHPPLTSIETRYYYRIPTYGAGKFENQFLRPLSRGAWLCVLAVSVLCCTVLLVSARTELRPAFAQYAFFSVIASICQQFFEDNSSTTRGESSARKLAILVTGLSCLLIYNYYTSSVVSWLLSGPPPSINSLQELLESPLELIFEDIGYTHSWLQVPTYYYNKRNAKIEDDIRQRKVLNKPAGRPLLENIEDGIRMVKAGGYAFHTEVDSANRLISRTFTQSELCELGSLQSMEKTPLYPCVQKNSPYKEFLVWSLMRLLERGIVRCLQHRTKSPPVRCVGSSPRALALGGAAPAFLLLAGGYILAVIILLMERKLWENNRKCKPTKLMKLRKCPDKMHH